MHFAKYLCFHFSLILSIFPRTPALFLAVSFFILFFNLISWRQKFKIKYNIKLLWMIHAVVSNFSDRVYCVILADSWCSYLFQIVHIYYINSYIYRDLLSIYGTRANISGSSIYSWYKSQYIGIFYLFMVQEPIYRDLLSIYGTIANIPGSSIYLCHKFIRFWFWFENPRIMNGVRYKLLLICLGTNKTILLPEIMKLRVKMRDKNTPKIE